MDGRVCVIGVGADGLDGLRPELRARIEDAEFLAGGSRHLSMASSSGATTFPVTTNLDELAAALTERRTRQRCVVLASGDPLYYGIGRFLIERLGSGALEFHPTVSSVQLAFAAAGLDWQDALVVSVHGRDLATELLPALGRPKVGVLSNDGESPAKIAWFFFERGLDDYDAIVAENLGGANQRITRHSLPDLSSSQSHFSNLNVVILRRRASPEVEAIERRRRLAPGIPDAEFSQPAEGPILLTHSEVRAVSLAQFQAPASRPLGERWPRVAWDVGAGIGGVSIEMALAWPGAEIFAAEQSENRIGFLEQNRGKFGAYNIRVVDGIAPASLAQTPAPDAVFLGGSGGRLDEILDLCRARLRPAGRLVANFVGIEHLALALERLKAWGWNPTITQIQVARSDRLGGLTALKPARPVFILAGGPEAKA